MKRQVKRTCDLRVLLDGQVHLLSGVQLTHSQTRPYLHKHFAGWTMATITLRATDKLPAGEAKLWNREGD